MARGYFGNSGFGARWRTASALDPKVAWDAYIKYGSFAKARLHLINPATDRPYSSRTVEVGAYKYALAHLDEVKPIWEAEAIRVGVNPTEDAWRERIARMAHCIWYYCPKKYFHFLEANNMTEYLHHEFR